ncbi:MAG: methylenetetrahydrofolate reductase, partial [Burkholderiaceae bacterium]
KTMNTVLEMKAEGLSVAPHISCIGSTRDSIEQLLAQYHQAGINRIVALRGDLPSGSGLGHGGQFQYAADLVRFVREKFNNDFSIEVAAYPEKHPQSESPQNDLKAFVSKANAGADAAITQYFFNPDAYFRFRDEAVKAGVSIPIMPGIMPITNYTQLARFSDACGAEIPRWIRQRLAGFGDDTDSVKAFGHEVVTKLCETLIAGGVPGLHFYTLNQPAPTIALCEALA